MFLMRLAATTGCTENSAVVYLAEVLTPVCGCVLTMPYTVCCTVLIRSVSSFSLICSYGLAVMPTGFSPLRVA